MTLVWVGVDVDRAGGEVTGSALLLSGQPGGYTKVSGSILAGSTEMFLF